MANYWNDVRSTKDELVKFCDSLLKQSVIDKYEIKEFDINKYGAKIYIEKGYFRYNCHIHVSKSSWNVKEIVRETKWSFYIAICKYAFTVAWNYKYNIMMGNPIFYYYDNNNECSIDYYDPILDKDCSFCLDCSTSIDAMIAECAKNI